MIFDPRISVENAISFPLIDFGKDGRDGSRRPPKKTQRKNEATKKVDRLSSMTQ